MPFEIALTLASEMLADVGSKIITLTDAIRMGRISFEQIIAQKKSRGGYPRDLR